MSSFKARIEKIGLDTAAENAELGSIMPTPNFWRIEIQMHSWTRNASSLPTSQGITSIN
ncbi:4840_t:CDS:2 [Funneliformis geosporum]|nr:4840_t:CDS:2 [Funneliformis geosporum]